MEESLRKREGELIRKMAELQHSAGHSAAVGHHAHVLI